MCELSVCESSFLLCTGRYFLSLCNWGNGSVIGTTLQESSPFCLSPPSRLLLRLCPFRPPCALSPPLSFLWGGCCDFVTCSSRGKWWRKTNGCLRNFRLAAVSLQATRAGDARCLGRYLGLANYTAISFLQVASRVENCQVL